MNHFEPSSSSEVNDRIEAKKESKTAIDFINELTQGKSITYRIRFIEAVRDWCLGIAPLSEDVLKMLRTGIKPMTKVEAIKFMEERVMPYGQYEEQKIGTVAVIDPDYLIWLCHAGDEFKNELKRFCSGEEFDAIYTEHKEKLSSRKKRSERENVKHDE